MELSELISPRDSRITLFSRNGKFPQQWDCDEAYKSNIVLILGNWIQQRRTISARIKLIPTCVLLLEDGKKCKHYVYSSVIKHTSKTLVCYNLSKENVYFCRVKPIFNEKVNIKPWGKTPLQKVCLKFNKWTVVLGPSLILSALIFSLPLYFSS